MRIVVCIRQSSSGEINPFDACCYEEALKIPNAEVILLSMGPLKAKDFLLGLTRLGAKKAVLLCDNAFAGADTLATSYTLSLAIKKLSPDMVFCGIKTMDGDTAQVGPEISEMCGMPLITNVLAISVDNSSVVCKTRLQEKIRQNYPALLTIERINNLRLPSIMSKTGEVEVWSANDINADVSRCGILGSPTKVLKTFENDTDLRHCEFIDKNQLDKVIRDSLKKKEDFLNNIICKTPLKNVWVVGKSPFEIGKTISDDITVVPLTNEIEISERIIKEKPSVVLWGSDYESKRISALVAAKLNLGLCADCVTLETDGETLYMYRPAFSGSIIAKIKSETKPAMATVRTTEPDNKPILVGVGMGAKNDIKKAEDLAKKYGGELVSSRLMVDNDYMPYEKQVGLTGKTVSPDVYIAVGISGAVHHISGIRKSKTIIAINSDKNAPIFKYADYGVVCNFKDI